LFAGVLLIAQCSVDETLKERHHNPSALIMEEILLLSEDNTV
jgi:hypothetical protein